MADPGEGPRGPDPPIKSDHCLRQPHSQDSLRPQREGENPGNEVVFETEILASTGSYNTF